LVLPGLPLVVAPHPMVAITLARVMIRITPGMGSFLLDGQTDAQYKQDEATQVPIVWVRKDA